MNVGDCGLCMFPDLRHNSNDFCVVNRFSVVRNGIFRLNCAAIAQFTFERCKHSKQSMWVLIMHEPYALRLLGNCFFSCAALPAFISLLPPLLFFTFLRPVTGYLPCFSFEFQRV